MRGVEHDTRRSYTRDRAMRASEKQLRYCKRSHNPPAHVAHGDLNTLDSNLEGVTKGVTTFNLSVTVHT